MAEKEELHDESRRVCDIKPTCAVFKIECLGKEPDNKINVQIGHLIGRSKIFFNKTGFVVQFVAVLNILFLRWHFYHVSAVNGI